MQPAAIDSYVRFEEDVSPRAGREPLVTPAGKARAPASRRGGVAAWREAEGGAQHLFEVVAVRLVRGARPRRRRLGRPVGQRQE